MWDPRRGGWVLLLCVMIVVRLVRRPTSFRRIEVITGVGRRRRWTEEEKAWIVAESLDPATTASAVARRYGLHASQLFVWRQRLAAPAAREALPSSCRCWSRRTAPAPAGDGGPDRDRARPGGGAGRRGRGRGGAAPGARGGAGPGVIAVPPGVRILLAAEPVDFRKGMDGLAALVQQALRADPFAGEVFIFRPRRADRVKILVYDGTGLVLYSEEAGGRAVLLALAGGGGGPAERGASSRHCSRGWRGTGCSPARCGGRARHGERKCWRSRLSANRIAPCRWRWMTFRETRSGCCCSCSI